MTTAAGYIRCSTEMQEESPEQQRQEILRFAERKGYDVVEWYVDFGISGTTFDNRPDFQRMLKDVENHPPFTTVICYDESRWGRAPDSEENTYWRFHFRRNGVEVVLVKTAIDPENEFAPMMRSIEGVQAAQYSKNLSELTYRGASNNGEFSSGGTAPYGFQRVALNIRTRVKRTLLDGDRCIRNVEKVKWEVAANEEPGIVRYIFERRAAGNAYIIIAEQLNRRGVQCPKRGRWKNHDQKWSTVTVKTIIENPSYKGMRVYNRNSMSKFRARLLNKPPKKGVKYPHWKNDRKEWITFEKAHPEIVSQELWEKANSFAKTPRDKKNGHFYRSDYLLSGLVYCAKCGFAFQGRTGKSKGHIYQKYIDGGYQNKRVCTQTAISKKELERIALNQIQEVVTDWKIASKVRDALQAHLQFAFQDPAQTRTKVRNELANVNDKISRLVDLCQDGKAPDSVLQRLRDLEAHKIELQSRLDSLARTKPENDLGVTIAQVMDFARDIENNLVDAPILERKELIKRIIHRIVIDKDKSVARFEIRDIPLLSLERQASLKNKKALTTEVVSASSSGGRT